jgi:hypothetical protein
LTVRATVHVEIEDQTGGWIGVEFVIDTGASFPHLGTSLASNLNLSVPSLTSHLSLRTATGLVNEIVRDGEIHLRFPQLPQHTFHLKCVFRDSQPSGVPPVLGLHNTIDTFSILFDGSMRPDALLGSMTFIFLDP